MYRPLALSLRGPLADAVPLCFLTAATLLIHGYHPWAEDGGLYVAGIQFLLQPRLYPKYTAFVTQHPHFSLFAPAIGSLVRVSHFSLGSVLFCLYVFSIVVTLLAALLVVRCCFRERPAHWTAVGLLAAWWTMPIAGTSLLLMDPYLTARSFSTPLSFLALGTALRSWSPRSRRKLTPAYYQPALCIFWLVLAATFHPLMAAYASCLVLVVRLRCARRAGIIVFSLIALLILGLTVWQVTSAKESPAVTAACLSRTYWFLSRWQWYEWLGLLGPMLIFAVLPRWRSGALLSPARILCAAGLQTAAASLLVALLFAQERFGAHNVARLQPLRAFLLLYAVMILLLGGLLPNLIRSFWSRWHLRPAHLPQKIVATLSLLLVALPMAWTQHESFPCSPHLEWPGRMNPNPWVQAFLWIRDNTPENALFALDSRYINTRGEDAQTFRAIALRSAVPDFSKDGGEASITPSLAPAWLHASVVTSNLSSLSDLRRLELLKPLGVQWVVLDADSPTTSSCLYRNAVVKVCRLEN